MFQELKPSEFGRVHSMFQGFDYSLSIHAAIKGNNPGRIFVDDVTHPRTAFALTVEGYLLAGEDNNLETNEALSRLFKERIFTGEIFVNGNDSMSLAIHPETWGTKLPTLMLEYEIAKIERYHYLCREVKFDWRKHVPVGYTVRRVDRALLGNAQVVFPGAVREWMDVSEMWWTEENFLAKGVSFVIIHEGEVVTWCTPDCVAGDRIDVGIFTQRTHRRKGLAAVAVAATVEYCLNHGFSAIGWHCNIINVGSWKTAEKVGFKRNREYAYYWFMYDPIDNLAELGLYYYELGDYAKTVKNFEQVFLLRDKNPDDCYHLVASAYALLGNKQKAIKYLQAAVDQGWKHVDRTKEQKEFSILHNTPEWEAVLARMAQNGVDRD